MTLNLPIHTVRAVHPPTHTTTTHDNTHDNARHPCLLPVGVAVRSTNAHKSFAPSRAPTPRAWVPPATHSYPTHTHHPHNNTPQPNHHHHQHQHRSGEKPRDHRLHANGRRHVHQHHGERAGAVRGHSRGAGRGHLIVPCGSPFEPDGGTAAVPARHGAFPHRARRADIYGQSAYQWMVCCV